MILLNAKEYELKPIYDGRKSFYGKAFVQEDVTRMELYSYRTHVATIYKQEGRAEVYGTYSATTLRHIKEFLRQNGYKAGSKAEIEKTYIKAG